MNKTIRIIVLGLVVLMGSTGVLWAEASPEGNKDASAGKGKSFDEVPVKGMVTMIDLGANSCIPCKMMAPIMEKLEKAYEGRAAIVFIDVWKTKGPTKRFNIRAIPTQIFFNKEGEEVYRHIGFMSEEAIVAQLRKMGVPDA
ncbi:MAG: thioredoxin family protein [Desulfatiglandales bacterium]